MPEELVLRARDLGYAALALTDHDGLYGAMEFAKAARAWGVRPITGAEVTLADGSHLTLLAATREGYCNLCRLLTAARQQDRLAPQFDPAVLAEHTEGLIVLSGCRQSEVAGAVDQDDLARAEAGLRRYRDWFGAEQVFVELQQNLVYGDTQRVAQLVDLARELRLPAVATNKVHCHMRERHRLQDALAAIRSCCTLDRCHRRCHANSAFYMEHAARMGSRCRDLPEANADTACVAERGSLVLASRFHVRAGRLHPLP